MKTRMQQFAPNHHYGAIIDKNKSLSKYSGDDISTAASQKKRFRLNPASHPVTAGTGANLPLSCIG